MPRDWSGVIAALKWVGVILFSATTAAAAVWEYQRRTAVPADRLGHDSDDAAWARGFG